MHSPEESARQRDVVQQAQQIADAAMHGEDNHVHSFTLTICDVDLPCFVADGIVHVQAPLEDVFDAFTAEVATFLIDLEARISAARRATLSLARDGCAECREGVAE